jgi:hypothetical protein
MPISAVSKKFNIPRSTLHSRVVSELKAIGAVRSGQCWELPRQYDMREWANKPWSYECSG